ncbi:MAG: EAL domain-containing protein [Betaproteobacteria bacterium]|nr:EAL domain-containing protein [Betaproteobacteria bacterium]
MAQISNTAGTSVSSGPDHGEAAIYADQVRLLYRLSRPGYAGTLINALIVMFALWNVAPRLLLGVWLVLVTAIITARFSLYKAYSAREPQPQMAQLWANRFITGAAAMGCMWGLLGSVLFPPGEILYQFLIVFLVGGMVASALVVLTPVKPAFLAFMLPALLPLTVAVFIQGGHLHVLMGVLLLVFAAVMLGIFPIMHETHVSSLRMRFENSELVARLAEANRQAVDANRQLTEQLERQKKIEEALRQSTARLEALIEASPLAIIVQNEHGIVKRWNRAAERIFGWSEQQVVGQLVPTVPADKQEEGARYRRMVLRGEQFADVEAVRQRKDGNLISVSLSAAPLRDADGTPNGMVMMVSDITERKKAERELERKTALARLLESLARAANDAASPEAAMRTCLERICEHGGWALGRLGIYAPGKAGRIPERSVWHARDLGRFQEFVRASQGIDYFDHSGEFISVVLRDKKPVWIEDLSRVTGFGGMSVAAAQGIKAGFALPVIVRDEVVAFLEFFADEPRPEDAALIAAADSVSGTLARLIERARAAAVHAKLAAIVECTDDAIVSADMDNRIVTWNPAAERMFGYSARESIGQRAAALIYPPGEESLAEINHAKARQADTPRHYEAVRRSKDGRLIDVWITAFPIRDGGGEIVGVGATYRDMSERKRIERRLQAEHAITRVLAESRTVGEALPEVLRIIGGAYGWVYGARWELDGEAKLMRCAETWCVQDPEIEQFTAYSRARTQAPEGGGGGLLRKVWAINMPVWMSDVAAEKTLRRGAHALKAGLRSAFGFPILIGGRFYGVVEFFGRGVRQPDADLMQIVHTMGSQIGQFIARKEAESHLTFFANHDPLTGLPNRVMFNARLTQALAQAHRYDKTAAVLFVDLDRFKVINDTLGHDAGDLLLKELALRLRDCLREGDTIGRQGGDEFVVLVEEVGDPQQVAGVAQKILETVAQQFLLSGQDFHVTASIGISIYPDDGNDVQALLKNADIAMYRAKEQGKNTFQFYSAQMNQHTFERLALETSLRRAVERQEFLLHYQPKIDIRSGRITGVEALVRWQHPDLGMVSPAQFIALAEETGLIVPIGEWVLRTACTEARGWIKKGAPSISVAVNLSARQFAREDFAASITSVLRESGLDPRLLELEITESTVMHNADRTANVLRQLKELGVSVAIDDFGTGYSSLGYLKRFPIDSVKIDRSFILDIPRDKDDVAITCAVIAMAHSLRLKVIAEGVETDEQYRFLLDHDCDEMQGYHFSKPVDAAAVARLLSQPRAKSKSSSA